MAHAGIAPRRMVARSIYSIILMSGAVALFVSIPAFLRALPGAPLELWVLVLVTLFAELTPLVIPHERRQSTQLAVSLSLTFGMLLMWGSAVAIVVQTLALGVAQLRLRRAWLDFALNAARFSLAFLIARAVEDRIGHLPATVGMVLGESGFWVILLTALAWLLVDVGLMCLMLAVAGPATWRMWIGPPFYYYVAASAGLLVFAPVLITAQTGWLLAFIAVPLALFGLIARVLLSYERNLNVDPVTHQRNLRGLSGTVERLLSAGALDPAESRLGFLQVRIGGLEEVMNVFGQQLTNDLVEQVGDRIARKAGAGATVGHITAADFAVVLPGADAGQAEHAADSLAHALTAPVKVHGVAFAVRPTIGVAIAPADGSDFNGLAERAETAIMDTRQNGALVQMAQNRDEFEARRRLEILVDLCAAIEKSPHAGELFMLYQPQVRINDGQLVGVEALVRWRHPDRGLVNTADMILTAEASGVISLLTFRVIDDVLAQLAAWSAAGLRLRASVNVSAKDFGAEDFAHEVGRYLRRHSIAPEQLELEVTESALVEATPSVGRICAELVAMGVGLSLDDFGTGFASIQQLRQFPLQELKIDRTYVANMNTNLTDRAVIASMTRLASDLGLRVVAEGVEDEATSVALGQIGPLIGQGWYYGRPMTAPDLVRWIRARPDGSGQPDPAPGLDMKIPAHSPTLNRPDGSRSA